MPQDQGRLNIFACLINSVLEYWNIILQQFEDQVKNALSDELKAKDEVIYNIGAKYLKIKSSKTFFQKKLEKLQAQNKKVTTCIHFFNSSSGHLHVRVVSWKKICTYVYPC